MDNTLYDLSNPEFAAARAAAAADGQAVLQQFDQAARRAENVVAINQRRHRSIWSAMSDDHIPPRSPAEILAQAKASTQASVAFMASPAGQFHAALVEAERLIENAYLKVQAARAAYDRGFPAGAEKASACADDASTAAADAAMQLGAAHAIAENIRSKAYEASRTR